MFGLIEGQRYDWGAIAGSPVTIPEVMIAGAVLLAAFGLWERGEHNREPLVPAAVFRDKAVALLCFLAAAAQFGLISIMILAAINMQSVLGYSAVISGLTSLPLPIVLAALAPFAGRLSDRIGSKPILTPGSRSTRRRSRPHPGTVHPPPRSPSSCPTSSSASAWVACSRR